MNTDRREYKFWFHLRPLAFIRGTIPSLQHFRLKAAKAGFIMYRPGTRVNHVLALFTQGNKDKATKTTYGFVLAAFVSVLDSNNVIVGSAAPVFINRRPSIESCESFFQFW